MCKKNIFLQLFVFVLILFSAAKTYCADNIERAKQNIYSLIDACKFTEAMSATDKLVADFFGDQNLPEARYWIAERYERNSNFDEAKRVYQQIIKSHPNSPFANKAKLGISRADVMSFVMSQKFPQAKVAIGKMAVDFASHTDLPEAIFWIAERYQRFDRFEEAKQIYQSVIRDYPNSPFADKAKLWLSRVNVTLLIASQDYDQAKAALNKFIAGFADMSDFPESLFWIAERYQRLDRFEEAKQIYHRIIQDYPDNLWAGKAKLWLSRVTISSLIVSNDYSRAQTALDRFIVDYAGRPELPGALYWIAERYDRLDRVEDAKRLYKLIVQKYPDSPYVSRAKLSIGNADITYQIKTHNNNNTQGALDQLVVDFNGNSNLPETLYGISERYERAGEFGKAKCVYQQIIQKYPDSLFADKAKLGITTADIVSLISSQKYDLAQGAYEKMVADFAGHPNLSRSVFIIGEAYYNLASQVESQGDKDAANEYLDKALNVWQKNIKELSDRNQMMYALYFSGFTYNRMGKFEKAIECYQKITTSGWPEHPLAAKSQFMIGQAFEQMGDEKIIPVPEAQKLAKAAYQQLLDTYPNCEDANKARRWMERHDSEKGGN